MRRSIVDRQPACWLWILAGVIILAVGVTAIARGEGYSPLTIDEAKAYALRVGPDEVARELVRLDWIEHTKPAVEVPAFVAVLRGRDLIWNWNGPLYVTFLSTDPDGFSARYTVTLRGGESKDFAPDNHSGEVLFWKIATGVAAVGGALLSRALR